MGAALAATATISSRSLHFLCVLITARPRKLRQVNNKAAHSRNLRTGRHSEPGRIYFVTSTCFDRQKHFSCSASAQILCDEFNALGNQSNRVSLAHVVMPDHFHWLVKPDRETTLQKLVRNLKGRSARRISESKLATTRIWQPGYHDHAVRVEEDLENLSNYLILNPVRAGLVSNIDDYPFWGSVWHQREVCRG